MNEEWKEGWPPVGEICEFKNERSGWLEVEVRYISQYGAVVAFPEGVEAFVSAYSNIEFRPIRTKAERDRAYWDEVAPPWATAISLAGMSGLRIWNNLEKYQYAEGDQAHKVFSFSDGVTYSLHSVSDSIPRPEPATEWDGSGRPPVGCECEVNLYGWWVIATVLAYGKSKFLYEIAEGQIDQDGDPLCGEHDGFIMQAKFRRALTKAERDRKELIISITANMGPTATPAKLADAILAAGWQKPE